ncbi:3-hydroxyacyl-CoA dehydrogenase family protein [Actinophytocola oryzae]|uniref:3-hydroxybutyryl-CoA dehydrogenase n=1 Tax=Actinophytocola oryzae TaxID=502181 RepID=A0A4R7V8Y3_9PSEU|nr:3-hydroxyacyl-CoA dehydrogenase family protein [Actinophytocola oryzae]TDV45365.1 3-hydroxybutyryl-CoA dehydrogenase [Actinophytocola oryzae]
MTRTAAVVGGGTMGAGIAHVLLAAGDRVTVAEAGEERADAARQAVAASLGKAQDRGKLDAPADDLLTRLDVVPAIDQLPGTAELVIEAVPEDVELKRGILAQVRKACPDALLASNTSSLSIRRLGDDVIGMHFFNPVPVQVLLELVVHDDLDPAQVVKARDWAESLGKTVIEVRDSPGFATSRLGVAVGLEAIRMLEEGVASAEDIDTGMRLGYGWPMGPLRLTDLVGLDVRLSIAEHLTTELGPRFAAPELLRNKVARGELGRKTGRGFFDWS